MKGYLRMAAFFVPLVLVLGACGDNGGRQAGSGGGEEAFRVALLLPGKINDKGWNAIGHAGLMKIKEDIEAEVAFTEDVAPADQEEAFRDYASQGFHLVLAMGGQYTDGALAVAEEFPDVDFGVIGSNADNGKNMASFNAHQEEVFFLGGVAAGLASKSKKIAYISGIEVDNVVRGAMGFEQGVKEVAPEAQVRFVWTGDFEDVAKAKEAAIALFKQGYDVVQANSNAATFGALEAAAENDALGIGAYGDYTFVAPEAVLANVLPAMDEIVFQAGQLSKEGDFEGKFYLFGFDDFEIGRVGEINAEAVDPGLAQEIEQSVEEYKEKIKAGEVTVEGPATE